MSYLVKTTISAMICCFAIYASLAQPAAFGRTGSQLSIVKRLPPGSPSTAKGSRSAYLMVYFKDEDHDLHFATSRDGYTFTDVNAGRSILSGRKVADQKGIRDPHITRGPDGTFYLAMTDLHIYAQREGLRTTQWERPEQAFGWGNNRNLILMKSRDLLHWTVSKVDVSRLFQAYRDAGAVWAPQTIYDPDARRMMVYFTTRHGNKPNFLVYSYADAAFTTLTQAPRQLFEYPRPGVGAIDADITRVGDKYHMVYVTDDKPKSLRQATSDRINTGYKFDPRKVDPENIVVEAPTVWPRYGTSTYVLMYDVFTAKPKNNMGFAETTDFETFRDIGRFNAPGSRMRATNFNAPKHGAVMAITPAEAARLEEYFAGGAKRG